MNAATQAAPPRTLTLDVAGIPKELRERDQWLCWRWEETEDKKGVRKWTKVPVNARTGTLASSTDPETWAPISVAVYYLNKYRDQVDGIGYVFAEDDPYCGIDLDKARDSDTGRLAEWAQAIIDRFDSFTEWSITGSGAHIIVVGKLPVQKSREHGQPIEVYDRKRFFVMSGQSIRNAGYIGDRQDELEAWHRETFPSAYAPKPEPRPASTEPLSVDDDKLLQMCQGSEKFRRLWDGNDGDYGDDTSSGDQAFCNIVVRNGGDARQIDELYRRSKRFREKWDSRRGDSTYGSKTIETALDGTVIPFTPALRLVTHGQPGQNPQDAGLPADDLPDDVASLKAIIIDLRSRVVVLEHRAERAEARADKLSEVQSKTTGILRNNKLGQERFTAVALSYQFGNKEASGDAGDDGLYRMPLARIAEHAGVSEDTASKHLQKLAGEGVIRREVKWVPQSVNRETGEITDAHKALFIGPATNVTDFVAAVSSLDPAKPKNWGGNRPRCIDHPDADVIKTSVWTCAECGEELHREIETIRPNPQDADLLGDELAATGTDGPRRRAPMPQRGYTSTSSGSDTASHNVPDASRSPVAAAWLSGRSLSSQKPMDMGVTL